MNSFRCFSDFTIGFNEQSRVITTSERCQKVAPLTVIVARNGMGKSAVLDAIRILFGTFTSAFDYPSSFHMEQSDIQLVRNEDNQTQMMKQTKVSGAVFINGEGKSISRELSGERSRTTTKDVRCLTNFGVELKKTRTEKKDPPMELPLIAYYGTGRLWGEHRDRKRQRYLARNDDYGYDYCLGANSNFKVVNGWLTDAILAELTTTSNRLEKDTLLIHQLHAIRSALSAVLEDEGYSPALHIDSYFKELAVKQGGGDESISIPIMLLSDGVRAVFGLVVDIAFRCAKLNKHLGDNAAKLTHGIVLIDEVELHLHPAWQQKILDTLQTAFPNIQFVVTTHSPQVVSSVPKECVRIIDHGVVLSFDTQTQGVESQDILAEIFGTSPAPARNEFVILLNKYAQMEAHGNADSPEGLELYDRLATHFGSEYAPLKRIEIHKDFIARMKKGGFRA